MRLLELPSTEGSHWHRLRSQCRVRSGSVMRTSVPCVHGEMFRERNQHHRCSRSPEVIRQPTRANNFVTAPLLCGLYMVKIRANNKFQ